MADTDEIIKEGTSGNSWYKLYKSGKLVTGTQIISRGDSSTISLPIKYNNKEYSVSMSYIQQYNPLQKCLEKEVKVYPTHLVENRPEGYELQYKLNKEVPVYNVVYNYNNSNICPVNKTAFTLGISAPKTVSFKGPIKTATVENVSSNPNVGITTGSVDDIILQLTTNQFISLKVDIQGARINNLPAGFSFIDNEIVGAAKNPGEYKFNIVSESISVPVTFKVKNIIRIG